jgi:DNA-binding response OmpR family regulator
MPVDAARRCQELGVASYLTKPVCQSDLLDAILVTLGRGEPEKEPKSEKIGDETWDAQHDSLVRRRRSWTHNQLTGSSPAS